MVNNEVCSMKFPTMFVNHGGGPMPLMGQQPNLVKHMREATKYISEKPKSIVVLTAHWEASPIQITNYTEPRPLNYDYYGFPQETYEYQYPAPGSPELSARIKQLLSKEQIKSELENSRGFDHGVFVPLMIMYPEADIPVVSVSLHASLDADTNMRVGQALEPLREEGVLILGSGFTFHNMPKFFRPTKESKKASVDFNQWLKDAVKSPDTLKEKLATWDKAPGGRISHPREEHLLPLFMVAAAGGYTGGQVIYDTTSEGSSEHAVTGFLFN